MSKWFRIFLTIFALFLYIMWTIGIPANMKNKSYYDIIGKPNECEMIFVVHDMYSFGKCWMYMIYPNGITKTIYGYADTGSAEEPFLTRDFFHKYNSFYSYDGEYVKPIESCRIGFIPPWQLVKLRFMIKSDKVRLDYLPQDEREYNIEFPEVYCCYIQWKNEAGHLVCLKGMPMDNNVYLVDKTLTVKYVLKARNSMWFFKDLHFNEDEKGFAYFKEYIEYRLGIKKMP